MYLLNPRCYSYLSIHRSPLLHTSTRDSTCRTLSKFLFSLQSNQSKLQYDKCPPIPYKQASYTNNIPHKLTVEHFGFTYTNNWHYNWNWVEKVFFSIKKSRLISYISILIFLYHLSLGKENLRCKSKSGSWIYSHIVNGSNLFWILAFVTEKNSHFVF